MASGSSLLVVDLEAFTGDLWCAEGGGGGREDEDFISSLNLEAFLSGMDNCNSKVHRGIHICEKHCLPERFQMLVVTRENYSAGFKNLSMFMNMKLLKVKVTLRCDANITKQVVPG